MSALLDTSVLVRYLTDDVPALADRAERIIEGADELQVTPVVLAETAHVLRRLYHVPREAIVDYLVEFVRRDNIVVPGLDKGYVVVGLFQCRPSGRVSLPDALVWATARSLGVRTIYAFDARFPAEGVEVRQASAE